MSDLFPRARLYALPRSRSGVLQETSARFRSFPYTERHLQCVWYDRIWRPTLKSSTGEDVVVEDPGIWNLEAGPDFIGAVLLIGPERRRICGDVEIHIHPSDWRNHQHASDPRYAKVRAHVTYFAGSLPDADLPPGAIQISMKDALALRPGFSFENIDPAVYPFAARAAIPPCLQVLQPWQAGEKEVVLKAAGEERLRRKSERMSQLISDKGANQAIYEEVMTALGYKHNKVPFRRLAELIPLDQLRDESGSDALTAYAILMGVSGLLPSDTMTRADADTRKFIRALWNKWWKRKEHWEHHVMEKSVWRLASLRPTNHPARRLMAAAHMFTRKKQLHDVWMEMASRRASSCGAEASEHLQAGTDSYWDFRLGFAGKKLDEPVALIGKDRAEAIVINVVIPFLAAQGEKAPFREGLLDAIPAEGDHTVIRQTAFNLFGSHHSSRIYKGGLQRQGLVQIFHDYCLNDRSRCASCTFPALLKNWARNLPADGTKS